MNTRVTLESVTDLDRLELQVARRADELARVTPTDGSVRRDRETWMCAENQLFTPLADLTPLAPAGPVERDRSFPPTLIM